MRNNQNKLQMRILALANVNSGVAYHRIVMPLVYMMQGKPQDYVKITNQVSEETLEEGWDILLINRTVAFDIPTIEFEGRHQPPDDRIAGAVLVVGVAGDRAFAVDGYGAGHGSLIASRSSVRCPE